MDLLEKIYSRRSVREFTKQLISKDDIRKIIEAGLRAPSSKNSCPWHILVLEGVEKDEVANWTIQNEEKRKTMPIDPQANIELDSISNENRDSTDASAKIVMNASILILIFNKAPFTVSRKIFMNNISEENAYTFVAEVFGLGACMQNMLLACHSLNLGAVPLADLYPAESKIKEKYNINYDFSIGIALGYPVCSFGKRKIKMEKYLDKFNQDLL